MGDLVDWLSRHGVAVGVFVVSMLILLWLGYYVLRRIDDSKPIRSPTKMAIVLHAAAALVSGYVAFFLPASPALITAQPTASPTPPPVTKVNSNADASHAPELERSRRPQAVAIRSPAEDAPAQTNSTNEEYTCGPPFYLAWWNLNAPAPSGREADEAINRCSGPMTENGYGRPFNSMAEALAAAQQANACAGPSVRVRADLDKC